MPEYNEILRLEKYAEYTSTPASPFCKRPPHRNCSELSLISDFLHRLQLVVWLVPSLIINAIAVSLMGVLFGPMYPIAISHAGRVIPRAFVTGAIGWITACSAAGAALLPFLTGMVAGKLGIGYLQPLYGSSFMCA